MHKTKHLTLPNQIYWPKPSAVLAAEMEQLFIRRDKKLAWHNEIMNEKEIYHTRDICPFH